MLSTVRKNMSNDYFKFRQFTVWQRRAAMKTGTDGVLLGTWDALPLSALTVLDIGTGTGLIALMLAQRLPAARVTGIDIDAGAYLDATDNFAASPFAARLTALHASLDDFAATSATPFDLIVCNPPYYDGSLTSPDVARTKARHTTSLSFRSLCSDVMKLLAPEGHFAVVLPTEALRQFTAEAAIAGLCLIRRTAVRTVPLKTARRHLLLFAASPSEEYHDDTQCMVDRDGNETQWFASMTCDFYL